MRNCEQLLGSLGLFAYHIGSLDKLNEVLSYYGPENCRGYPRITIKERKGQQTAIEKHNIQVASFSGTHNYKPEVSYLTRNYMFAFPFLSVDCRPKEMFNKNLYMHIPSYSQLIQYHYI